ncbi:MAG: glycoside hydrolase family 78 protein [Prevotella sp.]|nr:glycoside hydrolase family 78 protein [Prevotella sp.]
MKRLTQYLKLLLLLMLVSCGTMRPELYDLRCEGLQEPLGIDNGKPTFSWKIRSEKPMRQARFEVQMADGEGRVESFKGTGESNRLQWNKPLSSRSQGWWRVRIWSDEGKASRWSEQQRFGVGILKGDSLHGDYIGAVPGEGRSSLLRKEFDVSEVGKIALLHVNSLGYHEVYLNGKRVSEDVLTPAVSQMNKRTLIVTYDVTSLIKKGRNELIIRLGSGWYKPTTFDAKYESPLVKAELDALTTKGAVPLVWTDSSWEGTWSGYVDLGSWRPMQFGGERIDARVLKETKIDGQEAKIDGQATKENASSTESAGQQAPTWSPVDVVTVQNIVASPQMCEPCRVQETLKPISIKADGEGRWLVDFGRIVNGLFEITLPQLPAGHVTKASFGDFRADNGWLDVMGFDEYVSSGDAEGDHFVNRFNHHVFRYVLLENLSEAPVADNVNAMRIRTDFQPTATFESSDEELNKIHDMVAYTLDNLAFNGYMVDCASIERLGYGGDGNASTQTLQTLFATSPLYMNWLQAWVDAQQEDGGLPHTAPCPYLAGGGPYWCSFIVQAPWRTYMNYGDERLLERCYPAMKRWIGYVDAYTVDGLLKRWPDTNYRQWYLGDWAAPMGVNVQNQESVDLVNNCALCQVYQDLKGTALALGLEKDAADYQHRYNALKQRINEKLYHPADTTYASGSQIDMAYPLLVGIVPESLEPLVSNKLTSKNDRLRTGLVGIPVVTEWATQAGKCNWMYKMLKQHGYPGYLYMLDQGATATWEHWHGERSRMHNCFNGIGSWFYQALGGIIADEPGYRHVRIVPQVPEGLEWVHVTQETPYGTIVVRREGTQLHVELPIGVTATIKGREYTCGIYDMNI